MYSTRPSAPAALALAASLAAVAALSACSKRDEPAPSAASAPAPAATPEPAAAPAPAAPAGDTGTIKGVVEFKGEAPEMPKLRRDADPFCAKTAMTDETILVNDNSTLRNVLVRIKPGTVVIGPPPSEPITLVQENCMYRPRVQGVVADQKVIIKNSDQTTHNVHAFELSEAGGEATLFNLAQPKGAAEITKDTNGYEVMKFKCDVHPWMVGYIVVSDHPHFATTGDDGSFRLDDVPVGKYTLQAWHEHYGVKAAEVIVEKDGTFDVVFTYDGSEKKGG